MGKKDKKKRKGKKEGKTAQGLRAGVPPMESPDQGVWGAAELARYEPATPAAILSELAPGLESQGPTQDGALDAWLKLIRAAESLKSRLASGLASHKLTLGQFGVLEAVLHLGPLCQRDLAIKLQVSGGNMTTVIDNLERRGLARRERSKRDRRFISVHLTDAGKALITEVFPEQARAISEDMGTLGRQELSVLSGLCRSLGKSIQLK